MAYFAAQAVISAGLRCKRSSYAAIVRFHLGSGEGMLAEILLSVALIVAAISYIVGLVELLPDMLPITGWVSRIPRIVLLMLLLYPITLISSLAVFGPASAIATAGCYLQAAALVTQLFMGGTTWQLPKVSVWTGVDMAGLVYSMPMICFVYAYHYVLTENLVELKEPTRRRMSVVNLTAVGIMLGCYLPVALAGYLLYSGEGISSNVLAGLAPGSVTALVAKWSIGALLLITYSLFIIPLRQKLEKMAFGGLTDSMIDPRRLAIAGGLNLFVMIMSISLPDLGLANTLAGGCIALIMFFYPGRLMLKAQLDLPFDQRNPLRIIIGSVFVFFGALICVVGLFGNVVFDF